MVDQDISVTRRRLTQEHNLPSRINLLSNSQKKTQEKIANPTKNVDYDPLDFIDAAFETPPPRRRTLQLKDMKQEKAGPTEQEPIRKRPAVNDYMDSTNEYGWEDKERNYIMKLRHAEERAELYKSQLENIKEHYEKMKNIRTTEAEKALQEHLEWSQVKDSAFIELRDKVEEELLRKKSPDASNMNQANLSLQEDYNRLKATIARLEKQLQEKEIQLNKTAPSDPKSAISLFEDLTGVIVSKYESTDEANVYKCVMAGKNGSFQFTLAVTKGESETVFYKPTIEPDSVLNNVLPDFLKDEVDFEREHLQTFFQRMLTAVIE